MKGKGQVYLRVTVRGLLLFGAGGWVATYLCMAGPRNLSLGDEIPTQDSQDHFLSVYFLSVYFFSTLPCSIDFG